MTLRKHVGHPAITGLKGTNLESTKDRSCGIRGVIIVMPSFIQISTPVSLAQSSRSCMLYWASSSFISSSTFGMISSCNARCSDRMVASFSLYLVTRVLWAASRARGTDIIKGWGKRSEAVLGESYTPETARRGRAENINRLSHGCYRWPTSGGTPEVLISHEAQLLMSYFFGLLACWCCVHAIPRDLCRLAQCFFPE